MSRSAIVLLVVGLLAGVAWRALAGSMPGYFAAWLFWIGVPMGALPLVMGFEGTGAIGSPLLPVLRAMLPLLPLGTVLAIPLMGEWWTATLARRDGGILVVLSLLALVFWIRPGAPRRRLAAFGLLLSLCLVTVLGADWLLGPEPGLRSSLVGLLLMAGQMALAGAMAGLILAVRTRSHDRLPGGIGLLLGMIVAFWAFLQFSQYLVSWSANLPEEAAWYLARQAGIGTAAMAYAAIAAFAAITLLPSLLGRIPAAMATVSAMLVLALLLVTLLFVLPAFRGRMTLMLPDVLALLGLGDVLIGFMILFSRRRVRAR